MSAVSLMNEVVPFKSPSVTPMTGREDFWHRYLDHEGSVENEFYSLTATLDWDLEFAEFKSITGYRSTETERSHDQDGSSLNAVVIGTAEDAESISQEFRLANYSESFDWVAGLYYYKADIEGLSSVSFFEESLLGFLGDLNSLNINKITVESVAVFGQATYRFNDQFSLAVGGRYTKDDKESNRTNVTNYPAFLGIAEDYQIKIDDSWTDFSPVLALEYTPAENLMLYVSWRNGFKSGGFQSIALLQELAETPFDEEQVESWEAGIKSELLDQRLRINAAIYQVEYENLQKSGLSEDGLTVAIYNVGKSTVTGLDLSIDFAATEQLLLAVRYGYMDGEFDEYIDGDGVDLSGNTLTRTPEQKFSFIADYIIPMGSYNLGLRGEYNYTSDAFFTDQNLKELAGGVVNQPSFEMINARATFSPSNDQWRLSLWGKNLTDEEVCGHSLVDDGQGYGLCYNRPPLTYGASLEWFFK